MIENIIIIALFVYAISATAWDDHIFQKVGDWAEENLPEKIYKPFIGCPICMVPWWGTVIYLVADVLGVPSFQDARWFMILGTVIAAMGVNALIVKITGALDDIAESFKIKPPEEELTTTKGIEHYLK